MSKNSKLRRKLTAFVNQLTHEQAREQLVLAFLQMERCHRVLNGYEVEPVAMIPFDGRDDLRIDLELFNNCKKAAEENDYLNKKIVFGEKVPIHADFSPAIQNLQAVRNEVQCLSIELYNLMKFLEDE